MNRGAKALAVTAAAVLPLGGIALAAWYFATRVAADDDARSITRAGLFTELLALFRSGDEELAAHIMAAAPKSPAVAYADVIADGSARYELDPLLVVAVGDRESAWGFGAGYMPQGGPDGAGDRAPRARKKAPSGMEHLWTPAAMKHPKTGELVGRLDPPRWPNGAVGFGLGLMQIDAEFNWGWANTLEDGGKLRWQLPWENIGQGCSILRGCLDAFPGNPLAGIAAYNAGQGTVRALLAAGRSPDEGTTRKDYSSDVSRRFLAFGGTPSSLEGSA